MCGIIGIAGTRDVAPLIVEALKRLEYRGYDSAGVATLVDGHIERRRSPGKLVELVQLLKEKPLAGFTGIGHTRWATHGAPTERNAHPHASSRVARAHGITRFSGPEGKFATPPPFDIEPNEVAVHLEHYLDQACPPSKPAATVKRLTAPSLGDDLPQRRIAFSRRPVASLAVVMREGSPISARMRSRSTFHQPVPTRDGTRVAKARR